MTDFNTDVIEIPSENIDILKKKVDQVNKKAVKNGLVPMVLTIGDVIETKQKDHFGNVSYTKSYPVSIAGEYPAINGWKCIAKIDHRDGVNIVAIYDEIDVSKYRDRKPTCDHCGHNKIKVQSYLIQNIESGEILQIGKSCIKDYIKGDPKWMLQMLTWIRTLDEQLKDEFSIGGGSEFYYDIEKIASASALSIELNGFVGSGGYDYDKTPTVSDVNDFFFGKRDNDWLGYWKITDENKAIAKGMIEYFNEQSGDNNFVITIKQLLELGKVRAKFFSYIAGAVSGYLKHLDREAKKAVDEKIKRVNATVGEVKKRQDFNVTLESLITTSGFYGTIYVHKFRKDTGETIVWFANGTSLDREIGDEFTIKATVKKFDEYNGWKQTIVVRVKD